jgi:hypothetical protein
MASTDAQHGKPAAMRVVLGTAQDHASWLPEANLSSALTGGPAGRLSLDADDAKNGLGQLVLTLVKLLHELLEKQAIRRIQGGSLAEIEVERLGMTLMKQAEEIDRLRRAFNLDEADLNLDLGPLGRLL